MQRAVAAAFGGRGLARMASGAVTHSLGSQRTVIATASVGALSVVRGTPLMVARRTGATAAEIAFCALDGTPMYGTSLVEDL